ncbi:MAG: hypothetical protein AABW63_02680 [Nanoarchaeota archaeon]
MKKKGMEIQAIGWWILAIVALFISIGIIMVLKGKGTGALDFVKNLFRFGN